MSGTEDMKTDFSLLDVIRMLAFHGETGRLEIRADAMSGTFSFEHGKLVDAQMGSLTGFQAVNAAVSLREAHFSFDPSIQPLSFNAFPVNERIVLKRFFGIETAEPRAVNDVPTDEVDWDLTPSPVVPLSEVAEFNGNDSQDLANAEEEQVPTVMSDQAPTLPEKIVRGDADDARLPFEILPSPPARHRIGLSVIILLLLTAVAAFALVRKLSERRQPTLLAKSNESVSLPAAEQNRNATNGEAHAAVVPAQPNKQVSNDSSFVAVEEPVNKRAGSNTPAVREPQVTHPEPEVSSTHDLTGEWRIVNTVNSTSYRSFNNLEIGFRLVISQTGKEFTAKGEKISENGRTLPPSGRTPIEVTGLIEGDRVQATFSEQGSVRKTNGRFVWRVQNSGAVLRGTFASTAARSRGTSAAKKEL